ncbi:MAG TPA: hypothetical protein VKP03_01175 [Patescibacteria group bacterium]|nr:hypothetical protein [Patescibacteria group bacterium]
MFQTSQDLFYVVMAFCVLWFTVFLCWALYYLIKVLKQTDQVMLEVRTKVKTVSGLIHGLKYRILKKGLSGLISFFQGKNQKKQSQKRKTKTKKQ